jgi:hypothetical protein
MPDGFNILLREWLPKQHSVRRSARFVGSSQIQVDLVRSQDDSRVAA